MKPIINKFSLLLNQSLNHSAHMILRHLLLYMYSQPVPGYSAFCETFTFSQMVKNFLALVKPGCFSPFHKYPSFESLLIQLCPLHTFTSSHTVLYEDPHFSVSLMPRSTHAGCKIAEMTKFGMVVHRFYRWVLGFWNVYGPLLI
jgi:hypothetical protein